MLRPYLCGVGEVSGRDLRLSASGTKHKLSDRLLLRAPHQSDLRKTISPGFLCQDLPGALGIEHSLRALAFISRSTSA